MQNHSRSADFYILGVVIFLLVIGLVMSFSASPITSQQIYGNSHAFIVRHILFLIVGLMALVGGYTIPCQVYRRHAGYLYLAAIGVLLLTYLPIFNVVSGGASRWLQFGPIAFQPSELAKLLLITFLAHVTALKRQVMGDLVKGFLPTIIAMALVVLPIFLQPDLGTSMVIATTAVVMIWAAGGLFWHIAVFGLTGISVLLALILRTPYQLSRVITFLNPWSDPLGAGFNTIQSLLAVGSGGFWGVGIGQSKQKFAYLPQHTSDYVFSILAEEGGLWLATLVIVAFAVLMIRGLRTATLTEDPYMRLMALGITFSLSMQAAINIMVVTGMAPAKGIPLPFVSYGGSSMVVSLFMVGILLQISKNK